MTMETVVLIGAALAGTVLAALLACVPGMHIYNVVALLVVLATRLEGMAVDEVMALFMLGMVVGYAVVNTIPSIFLGAPDESAVFVVLPGQRYLMRKRGYEASVLTGVGGLGGLVVLCLLAPAAPKLLPLVRGVVGAHLHWILGAIILYMLMSEWPRGSDRGSTAWARLLDGWQSLGVGLLTFLLSGMLGLILFYSNLVPIEMAFQNLMPAFVGLFAIPWVLLNLISRAQVPPQEGSDAVDLSPGLIARGVGAGALGGLFAAFFPAVTGGIGGMLAGQVTAQRDDRLFLVSQGTSKLIYYAGAFMLFFAPALHLTRGGMAWMLSAIYAPHTARVYWVVVGATLLCGALAFLLLLWLSRAAVWLVSRYDYRWISAATLVVLVCLVVALTGPGGLLIAVVATGIGLMPAMWGTRRVNCMGVLLAPLTLNLAGLGPTVAGWMGLI